jgi:hypothetical protein
MSRRPALIAALLAASAAPVAAAEPGCRGTLAGSVRGSFACSAAVVAREGVSYFVVEPAGPVDGVPAYAPGAFEIPGNVEARTYDLDSLGMGRASVAAEGGTLYTATKTANRRGEVRLTLRTVRSVAGSPGAYAVHGTYRARLVPAGDGKTGEVIVEVRF